MTLKHTYKRFCEFGGCRLLWRYARMGMLGTIIKSAITAVGRGGAVKDVYALIRGEIDRKLLQQYGPLMKRLLKEMPEETVSERDKTVWSSWWQGEDNAPRLVKACWNSQRENLPDGWRHIVITSENYKQYISLPKEIINKMERGIIPQALFSDIIRLELLIKYGGMWMDATVLCTGAIYPIAGLSCPLFMLQYRGKRQEFQGFPNWFIAANKNNKTLKIVRALLYEYWRDYDCVVEYYIFHLFINTIVRLEPETLRQMPYANAWSALLLGEKLSETYDKKWWNKHTSYCCLHKLNYRKENRLEHSYCGRITEKFS